MTDSRLKKATLLLTANKQDDAFNEIKKAMMDTALEAEPNPKFAEAILAWQERHFSLDAYLREMAVLYAEIFTEDELDTLIEFSNSAIGQKSRDNTVRIAMFSQDVIERMTTDHKQELLEEFDRIMDEEEARD